VGGGVSGLSAAWWLARAGADWVFLAGHHPYRSNGTHGNAGDYDAPELAGIPIPNPLPIQNGDALKTFFDNHICNLGAQVYFSGHDHSRQWLDEPWPWEVPESAHLYHEGRTRCLFSRGATDINADYAHRYGVGFINNKYRLLATFARCEQRMIEGGDELLSVLCRTIAAQFPVHHLQDLIRRELRIKEMDRLDVLQIVLGERGLEQERFP
jgi:hypothetical protein